MKSTKDLNINGSVTITTSKFQECKSTDLKTHLKQRKPTKVVHFRENNNASVMKLKNEVISLR